MLKECDEMKEEIKNFEDFSLFIKQCYHTVCSVEKIQRVKILKPQGQKTVE